MLVPIFLIVSIKSSLSLYRKLFLFYLIRMVILTMAFLIAARPDHPNPGCYVDSWDWARLAFEILSLMYFIWKLFDEVVELKEK